MPIEVAPQILDRRRRALGDGPRNGEPSAVTPRPRTRTPRSRAKVPMTPAGASSRACRARTAPTASARAPHGDMSPVPPLRRASASCSSWGLPSVAES